MKKADHSTNICDLSTLRYKNLQLVHSTAKKHRKTVLSTSTANMPLEIHPCDERDLAEFQRIQVAAFYSGGQAMTTLLKPSPLPADYTEKSINKHLKSFREDLDVTYLKVVDTDLGGKMIAGAKWRINEKERSEEQVRKTLPVPGADEEGRPAAQDFFRYLARVRWEYMGTKPFCCRLREQTLGQIHVLKSTVLHILVTDPEHHRRGAGAMLVRWGTARADKAQLPAFLEATQVGRPLYAREGFESKHEEVFDLSKYGLQGTDVSTVMIREPLR
jgi:GNAT superfamily N-acetyltransferase